MIELSATLRILVSGDITAHCYQSVVDSIEHIAAIKAAVELKCRPDERSWVKFHLQCSWLRELAWRMESWLWKTLSMVVICHALIIHLHPHHRLWFIAFANHALWLNFTFRDCINRGTHCFFYSRSSFGKI